MTDTGYEVAVVSLIDFEILTPDILEEMMI